MVNGNTRSKVSEDTKTHQRHIMAMCPVCQFLCSSEAARISGLLFDYRTKGEKGGYDGQDHRAVLMINASHLGDVWEVWPDGPAGLPRLVYAEQPALQPDQCHLLMQASPCAVLQQNVGFLVPANAEETLPAVFSQRGV